MLQNGIKRNERFTFAILWHKRYFMAELSDNFDWEIVQLSYIERFKENAVKEKKAYCKRRVQLTPTRLAWYTNIMPTSGHVKTVYVLVMERQHCHMSSDESYMHSGHHYI